MIDIDGLDEDELVYLHRHIVVRLRLVQQMKAYLQISECRIDHRMQFERHGVTGMLAQFNRRTFRVIFKQRGQ